MFAVEAPGAAVTGNVLLNDQPSSGPNAPTGATLGAGATTGGSAAAGLVFNGDGTFTYTPPAPAALGDPSFRGYVTFTYRVTNAFGSSRSTTVLLAIGVALPAYPAIDVYPTTDWSGLGLEY